MDYKDFPDEETARELNDKYDISSAEEWKRLKKSRSRLLQAVALMVSLLFVMGVIGRFLQGFTWPSLDFLHNSLAYLQDPFIIEQRKAVVELQVVKREAGNILHTSSLGTGFNIHQNGLIVTNRHVVKDAVYITVVFPGHGKFVADEMVVSAEHDLAVLTIKENGLLVSPDDKKNKGSLPYLSVDYKSVLSLGEAVTVIGNPLQMSRIVVKGKVVEFSEGQDLPSIIKIDAPIHPGNSGSPVINANGNAIGVVYAISGTGNNEQRMGLAVPARYLLELIKEIRQGPVT